MVSAFSIVHVDQTIMMTNIPSFFFVLSVTVFSADNTPHVLVRLRSYLVPLWGAESSRHAVENVVPLAASTQTVMWWRKND